MEKEKRNFHAVSVTQIKLSDFLKVTVRNLHGKESRELEGKLKALFEKTMASQLKCGYMYIVRANPRRFERCHVMKLDGVRALVYLIDCNCTGVFHIDELRILKDKELQALGSQCQEVIVANIVKSAEFPGSIRRLHDLLLKQPFQMTVVDNDINGIYVDLQRGDASLADDLIPSDYVLQKSLKWINLDLQKREMRENLQKEPSKVMNTLIYEPNMKAYFDEPPMNSRLVMISSYDDSVHSFFIRYKDKSEECHQLMLDVNSIQNELIPLRPALSTAELHSICIIRFNNRLYRAAIVQVDGNLPKGSAMVRLLETGECVTINCNKMFKIPENLKSIPPFAKRFKLETITNVNGLSEEQINFYFKYLTHNKTLSLMSHDDSGVTSAFPTCKIYLGSESVAEKISLWDPFTFEYRHQLPLEVNFTCVIESVWGMSPGTFFATFKKPEEFSKKLQHMKNFPLVPLKQVYEKSACLLKFDSNICRGFIKSRCTNKIFIVELVDIGREDDFSLSEIMTSVEELMETPRLAYKCVLKGFEDRIASHEVNDIFEKTIKSCDEIQLVVVGKEGDSYVVELSDSNGKSVYDTISIEESQAEEISVEDWTNPTAIFAQQAMVNMDNTVHAATLIERNKSADWDTEKTLVKSNNVNTHWSDDDDCNHSKSHQANKNNFQALSISSSSGIGSSESISRYPDLAQITAVTSIQDFSIQRVQNLVQYAYFQADLQKLAKQLPDLDRFNIGEICLAFQSLDKQWCRAIILDAEVEDDFIVSLRCVDNGSVFCVNEKDELKKLTAELQSKEFFSRRCSLPVVVNPKRENEAGQHLMRLMKNSVNYSQIIQFREIHYIEIYVNDQNLAEYFIQKGFGKKMIIAPSEPVFVVHVKSLHHFCIQTKSGIEAIQNIRKTTLNYQHEDVNDVKVGMLVLARISSDKSWQRARIVSIDDGDYNVRFVDFGFLEFVKEIRPVDENIALIPETAIICSLALDSNLKTGKDCEENFKKIADNGKKPFKAVMVQPGENSVEVNLFVEGCNVVEKIFSKKIQQSEEKHFNKLFE